MRRQEVYRKSGFDGEFGQISVFTPEERERLIQGRFNCLSPQSSPHSTPSHKKRAPKNRSKQPVQIDHEPHIEELNVEQQQAVRSGPHPVLVLAGPGTGKTKTLVGRVEFLLDQGTDPAAILVVTFTRAAARELQERLQSMLPSRTRAPRSDTLHALAFEQWKSRLGNLPVLMSEQEARTIFARANPDLSASDLSSIWGQLSKAREQIHMPDSLHPYEQAYAQYKRNWNLADYTDLLSNWLTMLQTQRPQPEFSHLLVDEIQDLSELQGEIIRAMLPEDGTGFFGIGDPNQSIYGFRGAIGDVFEHFSRFWLNLTTITLHRNYRSRQEILDLSSKLCHTFVALQSQSKTSSGQLIWYQAESGTQEAIWIAGQIKKLIGGTGHLQADLSAAEHLAPGEIAVLVRLKSLIPPLQKALEQQGVPCAVPESTPFWQDERVQRILKTAAHFFGLPCDQSSNQLDCPEEILIQGPRKIAASYAQGTDLDLAFWSSQAFQDLCAAFDHNGDWINLLGWIQLEAEAAHIRQQSQKVRLLTMHAAKGLEFKAVFLPALEQGILPFAGTTLYSGKVGSSGYTSDLAEERRLLYVGLTRAQNQLFLSCAKRRRVGPVPVRLSPSNFLSELDWTHVTKIHAVARTRKREKQLSLLDDLE
jgi:superfamily I DNA/RNA helicase